MIKNKLLVALLTFALIPIPLIWSATQTSVGAETHSNQLEQFVQTTFTSLMNAVEQNNYTQFISQGNAAFKEGITKQAFTQVSEQLTPHRRKGYSAVFLGNLNQQGYQVYLWKLTFKDGRDDVLAILSLKDGKIGGFRLN